ncbi:CPXCG motif-containing cysteine-rich protein [Pleionea sediminis]|uniref:CPXCG motif-containing cysteine-rich protein n=1 Tax=Pleionea sediminis TaxID=2569479 RepID=UPI001186AAB5|nr:CPXCG motif-containing cysteine-rich protein [Pleionea sediminis]
MSDWEEYQGQCPYCGEMITLLIDCSESNQQYIEDCEVCCRPIVVEVSINPAGELTVILKDENTV